jgi:small subunit ribosomal protein S4
MGDPKTLRKKYSTPSHPWQKQRIDEENALTKEYGFKNKQEIWKLNSKLSVFKDQIKILISRHDAQAEKQKADLIKRMNNLKLVPENAKLEDILAVSLKDVCERTLQTVVFKKGLARSMKQSRQFITHEHIMIGDRMITAPSYLITSGEELMLKFADASSIASEDHPERLKVQKAIEKEMAAVGIVPEEKKEKQEKTEKPKKESKPRKSPAKKKDTEDVPVLEELTPVEDAE